MVRVRSGGGICAVDLVCSRCGFAVIEILGLRLSDLRVWVRWLIGLWWCSLGLGAVALALADEVAGFSRISWLLAAAWVVLGVVVGFGFGGWRAFWLAVLWAFAGLSGALLSLSLVESEARETAAVRALLHGAVLSGLVYSRTTFVRGSSPSPSEPPQP